MSTDTQERTIAERFYGYPSGLGIPSEKSLKFLLDLVSERVAPSLGAASEERLSCIESHLEWRPEQRVVSRWIDYLLKQPVDKPAEKPAELKPAVVQVGPGVYETSGDIFVVKATKDKQRLYALRLIESPNRVNVNGEHVEFDFEYARGAIYRLKPEDKMTAERAKHYLVRYGRCLVCRRKLKAAVSVARGVGPVCMQYFA